MPGDLPRFRNQIQGRSGQGRHVQRLANVTSSVRPAGVLVNEDAATGEIQQGHAAQYRERSLAENQSCGTHLFKTAHLSVAA